MSPAENSDVFPFGSVTVAVTTRPVPNAAGTVANLDRFDAHLPTAFAIRPVLQRARAAASKRCVRFDGVRLASVEADAAAIQDDGTVGPAPGIISAAPCLHGTGTSGARGRSTEPQVGTRTTVHLLSPSRSACGGERGGDHGVVARGAHQLDEARDALRRPAAPFGLTQRTLTAVGVLALAAGGIAAIWRRGRRKSREAGTSRTGGREMRSRSRGRRSRRSRGGNART